MEVIARALSLRIAAWRASTLLGEAFELGGVEPFLQEGVVEADQHYGVAGVAWYGEFLSQGRQVYKVIYKGQGSCVGVVGGAVAYGVAQYVEQGQQGLVAFEGYLQVVARSYNALGNRKVEHKIFVQADVAGGAGVGGCKCMGIGRVAAVSATALHHSSPGSARSPRGNARLGVVLFIGLLAKKYNSGNDEA